MDIRLLYVIYVILYGLFLETASWQISVGMALLTLTMPGKGMRPRGKLDDGDAAAAAAADDDDDDDVDDVNDVVFCDVLK